MTVSQAQLKANSKYRAKAYDSLTIQLKKGTREDYKKAAIERGLSLAALFRLAVDEYIQNHSPLQTE